MAKSLLNLVNRKIRKRFNESVRLAIKADESDKEDILHDLEDAGIDDIEETEDGLTVKTIGDMEDTVREVCSKYECNCESEDPEDEVDEDDDEYNSDSEAEVKNSTVHPEVDEEEEDDEVEEEDDEEDSDVDEEDDEDDDVDEEDNEPGQVSHDVGTQKAHPNEEEEDDEVEEEDDEEDPDVDEEDDEEDPDVDEEEEEDDEVEEEDDEEDSDVDEEDDEEDIEETQDSTGGGDGSNPCENCKTNEELKACIQNQVREDIRTIAKTMKLDENLLSQVETSFIAALERRARSIAKVYTEHRVSKIKRQTAKELRKVNEQINKYVTYVAKDWVAKNKIKIESKLKVQLAENLIKDIKTTLKENAISAPSATRTLKKYSTKINKLQRELNASKVESLKNKSRVDMLESAIIIDDVATRYGLSANQKENFMKVVNDSIDITSMSRKNYMKHVEVMAEMYVGGKKALKESVKQPNMKKKKELSRKDIYMKYLGQDKFL